MKKFLKSKSALACVISVLIMAAVSLVYFYPDVFEGNGLMQHDVQQGIALSHEVNQYKAETGETSWWTNSLFSGMPTFQITPSYSSNSLIRFAGDLFRLWLPSPAGLQIGRAHV